MPPAQFLAALAPLAPAALVLGTSMGQEQAQDFLIYYHSQFSAALPPLKPGPFRAGVSIRAVSSLGSASNDPVVGSHLAAGFTGFLSLSHLLGDPV